MNQQTRAGTPPAPLQAVEAPEGWTLSLPLAAALYFALALVYFFPAFLPGRHIFGTDYLVGGYFFHEFISQRFSAGVLPKWVPGVYGGLPLFANPGSAYYPFRFLADLIFPVSRIWPTLFVIQFTLAGVGMYLLSVELKVREWVAFVAGLAFQFTGLTMAWVLAGHEGRIIVATFAPLLFYFLHRGVRTARFGPFVGAAAVVGFCLLSFQIQTAYYLLLGGALWSAFAIWDLGVHRDRRRLTRVVALGIAAVAFGFALASVNFLPFLDYIDQSPRAGAGRGYDYSTSFSMPVAELSAIAVPEMQGYLDTYHGSNPFKLHTEYMGAVAILLAALGFYYARRDRRFWFFVGLAVFTLTLAFGGNTPIYHLYYSLLPGTRKFRAPSISFFLFSLSLVAMAALALEALAKRVEEREVASFGLRRGESTADTALKPATWILVGVVVVGFLMGAMATSGPGAAGAAAYRFAFFAAAAAAVLWSWMRGRLQRTATLLLLAVLTVSDLWIMDRHFFSTVPSPDQMFAADDVVDFLKSQPGRDRVWALPSYVPPGMASLGHEGNYLMHFDIDQAGGEHGNQLQRWNEYVGAGTDTYVDWHNFLQNSVFPDAANIRYIISGTPLQAPGLRMVHQGFGGVVYENPAALPRTYLVPEVVTTKVYDGALALMSQPGFDPRRTAVINDAEVKLPQGPLEGDAQLASYTPDEVQVRTRASREALLVLADNYYPGWEARIDDRPADIVRADHTFRGVVVPAGEHTVTFSYEPTQLRIGFVIYLVGMVLLVGYGVFAIVRSRRRTAAA
jgi:hypothetical protein